jgi:hypothetical protein
MKGDIQSQRLIVYQPDTEERVFFPVGEELRTVGKWSPSGKHILLMEEYKSEKAHILSLDTGNLTEIVWESPRLFWIAGDRLMWSANSKLSIADADGANQREFMVIEGDKYRFSDGGEG